MKHRFPFFFLGLAPLVTLDAITSMPIDLEAINISSILSTVSNAATLLCSSYSRGRLSEKNVRDFIISVCTALPARIFGLGDEQMAALKKGSLAEADVHKILTLVKGELSSSHQQLHTLIKHGKLDQLATFITYGIRYAHDELGLIPGQVEKLYKIIYQLAEAHKGDVDRVGMHIQTILTQLKDRLLNIETKEQLRAAMVAYEEDAKRALESEILPFMRRYNGEIVRIFNIVSTTDYQSIDFLAIERRALAVLKNSGIRPSQLEKRLKSVALRYKVDQAALHEEIAREAEKLKR